MFLRAVRRYIGLFFKPFPSFLERYGALREIVTGLVLLGIGFASKVQAIGSTYKHLPGGTPSVILICLLMLALIAGVRLTFEQVTREDWEGRAERLHEHILKSLALENRYVGLFANDKPMSAVTQKEIDAFAQQVVEWQADFVEWVLACANYLRDEWGTPQASRFEVMVVPVTPAILKNPQLQVKATDKELYRRAVVERRKYLDGLMGSIEAKVTPH